MTVKQEAVRVIWKMKTQLRDKVSEREKMTREEGTSEKALPRDDCTQPCDLPRLEPLLF